MLQMIEEGHRTGEISSKITAESFLIFMNMIIEHSKTLGKAFEKTGSLQRKCCTFSSMACAADRSDKFDISVISVNA